VIDTSSVWRMEIEAFGRLLNTLQARGYRTIGPVRGEQAIYYDDIGSPTDLPVGWGDEQAKGRYRLRRLDAPRYFGFNLSHDSWKRFVFPRRQLLMRARRQGDVLAFEPPEAEPAKMAFIGVRACELAAMKVHRNALGGHGALEEVGPPLVVVAVNCSQSAPTCFCVSQGTGPSVAQDQGADIVLTEICGANDHYFVARALNAVGGDLLLAGLTVATALTSESEAVAREIDNAARTQSRTIDLEDPGRFFEDKLEHSHWQDVAQRCLSCANCTLVCPTCFCTTVEDTTDLAGDVAERWLTWDSCFHSEFSHVHGGPARESTSSRYRQWLTHKVGTWHAQFGESGCVGCGRCITWCPVGIDLTVEIAALKGDNRDQKNH